MSNLPPPPPIEGQGALLLYYKSDYVIGDRSPMGPMVDRAETYSVTRVACKRCDGDGEIINPDFEKWCERRNGFKETAMGVLFSDGDGEANESRLEQRFAELNPEPPTFVTCPRCNGDGDVEGRESGELTARPTGSSVQRASGSQPREEEYHRVALASRCWAAVNSAKRLHGRALDAYYGNRGDWCEGKTGNRLIALIPMVQEGKRVLNRYGEGLKTARQTLMALHNWSTGTGDRKLLFDAAEKAAYLLLVEASKSWEREFGRLKG